MRSALAACVLFCSVPLLAQPATTLRVRLLQAEDARGQSDADLAALRQGLSHRDPKVRLQAVRAIGRLERPDLIRTITPVLDDDVAAVRIEAANAMGQAAKGEKGVADAKSRLLRRARIEQDPGVWGAVAATLGRLQYTAAADVDEVEAAIARVLPTARSTSIQIDAVLGAVEGLEALARQSGKLSTLKPATIAGLRAAAGLQGRPQEAEKLARIRRLAALALSHAGAVTRPGLEAGAADPDEEVRRLTMLAARAEIDGRDPVILAGLVDPSPRVRYEALRTYGRVLQKTSCARVLDALGDASEHVVLLAIDLLANPCPDGTPRDRLLAIARLLPPDAGAWHRAAHALVSLAAQAPESARELFPRFASHPVWQVRMYAARAAGRLALADELIRLARDAHHNVREAALSELIASKHPETTTLALEALAEKDYQLVMTAARALSSATDPARAVPVLRAVFDRIAAEGRDTSRDAREAIRNAVAALGGPELPAPVPQYTPVDGITDDELDRLANARLRFRMAGRGAFELRLLVDDAPITAVHIARLARSGYYDGLTFHRVVPNFVIQGGSPGANEYAGQGPYMRDEVGLVSHRRGTVGISTRGRDTGDAQIFINLVDSPRLDHTYTVFAEVAAGMDIVDAILEGDVIEAVDVLERGSS